MKSLYEFLQTVIDESSEYINAHEKPIPTTKKQRELARYWLERGLNTTAHALLIEMEKECISDINEMRLTKGLLNALFTLTPFFKTGQLTRDNLQMLNSALENLKDEAQGMDLTDIPDIQGKLTHLSNATTSFLQISAKIKKRADEKEILLESFKNPIAIYDGKIENLDPELQKLLKKKEHYYKPLS